MSEVTMVALCSIVGLLVLILVALVRIGSRLKGIEQRLAATQTDSSQKDPSPETSYDGAFGKFIGERPELLVLKKSEQFAAFRKWRKEQGLNWEGK